MGGWSFVSRCCVGVPRCVFVDDVYVCVCVYTEDLRLRTLYACQSHMAHLCSCVPPLVLDFGVRELARSFDPTTRWAGAWDEIRGERRYLQQPELDIDCPWPVLERWIAGNMAVVCVDSTARMSRSDSYLGSFLFSFSFCVFVCVSVCVGILEHELNRKHPLHSEGHT